MVAVRPRLTCRRAPVGAGTAPQRTTDQREPFKLRITVRSTSSAIPQREIQVWPTATAPPPGSTTIPLSIQLPPGLGLSCDQSEPFERRIADRNTAGDADG